MTETFAGIRAAFDAARAAQASGDVDRAAAIYRSIPALFPAKKTALPRAAAGLRTCGRWSDAVALLEAGLARNPVSPAILMALAETWMELKKWDRAAVYIERHLARDATHAGTWRALGDCHACAGNWAGAEAAYARALALAPLDADAARAHGDVLFSLGRRDEGVNAYRRAVAGKPGDALSLFKLGSALAQAQMLDEAERTLRESLALDPANPAAHVNLATALYHAGRGPEAAAAARAAVAAGPDFAAAHATLGTVLLELGRIPEAAEALSRADALSPGAAVILTELAAAQGALGRRFDAERTLQRILSIEPGNLEARHLLAAPSGEPVRSVPQGYPEQLFDWLAARFDRLLAGPLRYRGPEETLALLRTIAPDRDFANYLDLGCGTGVIGAALAGAFGIGRKTGVDASGRMIGIARGKGIYDALIHGDAGDHLAAHRGAFDLVTAIDLFIHVGDLAAIMPLIAAALAPGGLFVYTVEALEEGRYRLMPTGHFAHSLAYVEDLAGKAGLTAVAARPATLRLEKGTPVTAVVGAFRR